MTTLPDLQKLIRRAVYETDRNEALLQAASGHIQATPGLPAVEHLRIYRRAILGTMVRALTNIYPVCQRLVGDEFFDAMARVYARRTPSRSPDLADYGGTLADFIRDFEPAASLPYLPDVARLEWHWHRAFNAADEEGLDIQTLSQVRAEDMHRITFQLPVSAALLESKFPIDLIWQVNQADWHGDNAVDLDEGGVQLIVWRQRFEMRIDALERSEWRFLRGVDARLSLGQLSEAEIGEEIETLLPRCVQRGWIGGFELTEQSGEQ